MKKVIGGLMLIGSLYLSGCQESMEQKQEKIVANKMENAALQAELKADSLEREAEALKARAESLENTADQLRDSARSM